MAADAAGQAHEPGRASGTPLPGEVDVLVADGRVEIVLSGEVDQSMEAELLECLASVPDRPQLVVLDTRAVTFMDSVGIALVGRLVSRGPVRMPDPPGLVRYLLDAGGLLAHVQVVERPQS
ncbi:STAS domain-containing protein [Thalassiella azotivora]